MPMYSGLCVFLLNLMISVFGLFLSISIFVSPFHGLCKSFSWLVISLVLNLFYVSTVLLLPILCCFYLLGACCKQGLILLSI
jgi:hypothetical protein